MAWCLINYAQRQLYRHIFTNWRILFSGWLLVHHLRLEIYSMSHFLHYHLREVTFVFKWHFPCYSKWELWFVPRTSDADFMEKNASHLHAEIFLLCEVSINLEIFRLISVLQARFILPPSPPNLTIACISARQWNPAWQMAVSHQADKRFYLHSGISSDPVWGVHSGHVLPHWGT
jgi:hypothetical protein